jgi:hypothetical protein
VEKREGVWWLITPEGKPFFSMGVNVVDQGAPKDQYSSNRPEYAASRHYSDDESWRKATLGRLQAWNFNTLGAWSAESFADKGPPYTVVLDLGASIGAPWCDLFSQKVAVQLDHLAQERVRRLRDDSNLLGYFCDNELGWWDDTLFLYFLKEAPGNATRQILLSLLEEHYLGDFDRLSADFETGTVRNFQELRQQSALKLKLHGQGMMVINEFVFRLARRYYELVNDSIRRYDPHHLILGDRYANWYPQAVARAAGPYVDVISTNQAADWTDGNLADFYCRSLHELAEKPVLISEFYFCARENRSGNKNSSANFPTVDTQSQRASSFDVNLRTLAGLPFVVGAHWFQYYDEPTQGRRNGEDYNMGLVDIDDKAYEELTETATSVNTFALHQQSSGSQTGPDRETFVAPAPFEAETGLLAWDKRGMRVSGAHALPRSVPFADLYAAWDAKFLYLAIYAADFVDAKLYPGDVIPAEERMLWTLQFEGQVTPVEIRFGPGGDATAGSEPLQLFHSSTSTRHTVAAKLSASRFGKSEFVPGDFLKLTSRLTSHSRAEEMQWDLRLRLGQRS